MIVVPSEGAIQGAIHFNQLIASALPRPLVSIVAFPQRERVMTPVKRAPFWRANLITMTRLRRQQHCACHDRASQGSSCNLLKQIEC